MLAGGHNKDIGHSCYFLSFLFASGLAALAMFCQLMVFSFPAPMPTLMCLGGPTFMVLNLASHPLPLPSLSLDPPSSSSLGPFFFRPPAPPVWHDSFCSMHPAHAFSSC